MQHGEDGSAASSKRDNAPRTRQAPASISSTPSAGTGANTAVTDDGVARSLRSNGDQQSRALLQPATLLTSSRKRKVITEDDNADKEDDRQQPQRSPRTSGRVTRRSSTRGGNGSAPPAGADDDVMITQVDLTAAPAQHHGLSDGPSEHAAASASTLNAAAMIATGTSGDDSKEAQSSIEHSPAVTPVFNMADWMHLGNLLAKMKAYLHRVNTTTKPAVSSAAAALKVVPMMVDQPQVQVQVDTTAHNDQLAAIWDDLAHIGTDLRTAPQPIAGAAGAAATGPSALNDALLMPPPSVTMLTARKASKKQKQRRLRSRNSYIDQHLQGMEGTDSYADLEDWIVPD